MGWVTVVRLDVDETQDTRLMVEYCPACAEAVLDHRRSRTASRERLGLSHADAAPRWLRRGSNGPGVE